MSFFNTLFRGKRERSSDTARDRLLKVLVDDRFKITPSDMEQMKIELSEVLTRYLPGVDASSIEVSLARVESTDYLKAELPLRRTPERDTDRYR